MQLDIYRENAMLLLAATAKVAIRDANRGDDEARKWLCEVVPEWTRYATLPQQKPAAQRKAGAGGRDRSLIGVSTSNKYCHL